MDKETEDLRTSPKKKRNPQMRDRVADHMKSVGSGLGSGRSLERAQYVVKTAYALKEKGKIAESQILLDTLNSDKNLRGTYEIARLPEEVLLALCEVVIAREARDLLEAKKLVDTLRKEQDGIEDKVMIERTKNGMYRITSRSKTTVLLSAQDLIELSAIIQSNMYELQEQVREDLGTSAE